MVGFELNSNVQYDMVIKKKFAKYVIDNKARLIERKPGVSIDNEKSKSIFAQAFQCSIQNVQQIFQQKVQIQFKEKTSPESFVKMDISVCKDNGSLSFSLIFEDSLMQYLPELNNDNYKNLFVSFASTTVDNFLFLQFANTNLQIRTLMINCEDDVERVFQEKSFYSLPTPLPSSWTRFKILIPGKEDRDIVNDNATLDEKLLISFCNSLKNLKFQKENYHSYEMAIENKVFDLYFHESNLERIRHLKEQKIQSFENFDKDLYIIKGVTGETIAVKEIVINFEEIPRTILTCSSFLVDRANQSFLQDNGLMIEKMKIEQGRSQDSISIVCPFPQCKDRIVPNSEKYSAISHFLNHQDFRRVVSGKIIFLTTWAFVTFCKSVYT